MIVAFPLLFGALAEKFSARPVLAACLVAAVSACAAPPPPATPHDPDEAKNRDVHAFNLALDKALVRPTANAYGSILPAPVQEGVANFAENLDLPGDVANGILQARPHFALQNTTRFLLNTTLGIGGLFDPAGALGLHAKKTDFGETLHVWGVGEGAYMELPGLGPSTGRDTMGTIVDIVLNPVSKLVPAPESHVATVAKVGSKLGDRDRYSETLDSVLYDSADSYAQARLLYLQNRRFELGQTAAGGEDAFLDPYEDPYGQ
mgnify:CR=1 FL=1